MAETTQVDSTHEVENESLAEGAAQDEQVNDSPEESEEELDPKILKKQLKEKQNREVSLTRRLREAEDKLKGFENEKLTEAEKQKKQVEELTNKSAKQEGSLKNLVLKDKLNELKADFGIRSPKLIAKLIDTSKLEFDVEDALDVSGVEEELKRLKKEDPELFIKGGTNGGSGVTQRGTAIDMNALIRGR